MSNNRNAEEVHGCIVCARLFNVLSVYTPEGNFVDCTVMSPGGHCLSYESRPLVACDSHSSAEIDEAFKRWLSRNEDLREK